MKNPYRRVLVMIIGIIACLLFLGGSISCQRPTDPGEELTFPVPPAQAQKIIERQAGEVILAIKNREMEALAEHINPRKGVRFSPYAIVHQEENPDRVLSAAEVKQMFTEQDKYLWGIWWG